MSEERRSPPEVAALAEPFGLRLRHVWTGELEVDELSIAGLPPAMDWLGGTTLRTLAYFLRHYSSKNLEALIRRGVADSLEMVCHDAALDRPDVAAAELVDAAVLLAIWELRLTAPGW